MNLGAGVLSWSQKVVVGGGGGGEEVRIALLHVAILKSTVTETMAVFILEMTLAGRRP